jgi:hypothetical protein
MTKDLVLNMDKKENRYEKLNKDVRETVHKTERQLCDVNPYAGLLLFKPDISNIDFVEITNKMPLCIRIYYSTVY